MRNIERDNKIRISLLTVCIFSFLTFPLYYQASLERTFNSFDIYVIFPFSSFTKKKKKEGEEKTLRYCALETH